jgi:kynurenine formamidase
MRLTDLLRPLYNIALNCPRHPPVSFRCSADHLADGWRMEEIAMATHTGSHLDAPRRKIAGGRSISELPLETFVGPVRVADLPGLKADAPITAELLLAKLAGFAVGEIVSLATGVVAR